MNQKHFVLSFSYWFSSRSMGLLLHPYLTLKTIYREKFMRPLVWTPLVFLAFSWMLGMLLSRIGIVFQLERIAFLHYLGMSLLLMWVWGALFMILWQIVLGYLALRFRHL